MINFNPFLLKFSVGLISSGQEDMSLAVVVAQLVEGSLPTPEVRGSNPVIGKLLLYYMEHLCTGNCIGKAKINIKDAGNGPLFF